MYFGIQRKIPDAIRLGESILSDQGGKVPHEMQIALKDYLLNENN